MTKEEIIEMARKSDFEIHPDNLISFDGIDCTSELIAFAKLIAEKAIKEALAQPEQEPVAWEQFYPDIGKPKFVAQPEQEPVAWIYRSTGALFDICPNDADEGEFVPLYTTPPQRKTFNHHEFGYWWFEYGSGLFPLEGEDQEEHSYRVATAAWQAAHGIKGD